MKIALLIPTLRSGGAERVAIRMADVLSQDNEVCIIVFSTADMRYACNHRIISLDSTVGYFTGPRRVFNAISRILQLKRVLDENEFDVCFSFGDSANVVSLLTPGRCKRIVSLRGYAKVLQPDRWVNRWVFIPMLRRLYARAAAIVCVSKKMREDLVRNYRLDTNSVRMLYNGYDVNEIRSMAEHTCDESFMRLCSTRKVIIAVGTLRYAKGYWHLIRAFRHVREEHPDTHLVILGNNHADNRMKLDRLVESLGLTDAVSFLGFDENPFKYIARSDIYVLSSISEGFPNSLVEAMACGTPVIAADCMTGPREILRGTHEDTELHEVEHTVYGVLVPAHEPAEIYDSRPLQQSERLTAKAIVELLRDEKLRRYYGDQAKKRAADFGYSRWKDNIYEILRD